VLATMPLLIVSCLLTQTPPEAAPPAPPAPIMTSFTSPQPTNSTQNSAAPSAESAGHGQPGILSITNPPALAGSSMPPAAPPVFAPPATSYLPPSESSWQSHAHPDGPNSCGSNACAPQAANPIQRTAAFGSAPAPQALPEPMPLGTMPGPVAMPAAPTGATELATGPQSPCLLVESIGPASISPSKPFVCEVVARNIGTFPVFNVRLEDQLPAAAHLLGTEPQAEEENQAGGKKLIWSLARLDPGSERRFKVTMRPALGVLDYVCTATASFSVSSAVHSKVAEAKLALSQMGPDNVQVGDRCNFQIRISNAGTGPASHVVLRERLPAGLKHPEGSDIEADFGTIAPGATKTVLLQTTAVGGGLQRCDAQVTAEDGVLVKAEPAVSVTEPVLFLHATGPAHRIIDHEADFKLEVMNNGTAAAENVVVNDTVPAGLDFVSASEGGQYDPANRRVHWTVGSLPPGEQRTLTLKLLTRSAGDLVNSAVARADRGLEAKAQASLHAEGIAALLLEVVDLQDPIEVGSQTTYEIRVVNQGTATSTDIQIIATVPEGMSARGASGPVPYRVQGNQIFFEPLAKLAAHADCVFRVNVIGQQPGDWRFKVQMSCDQLRTPVYKEESTRVYKE
jgi:uncharacterized repeat protein (TIGR01451 family)